MKPHIILSLICLLLGIFPAKSDNSINGEWSGTLHITPQNTLKVVLDISYNPESESKVTLDSPDQGAFKIPMTVNELTAESIAVSQPQMNIRISGTLRNDTIFTRFSQGPFNTGLSLTRKQLSRPQTPQPPFPYHTEDVSFKSPLDGNLLYGTLCLPEMYHKGTPIAILISGSGTQNRDEELFDHRPFAVIADFLAKRGIGTMRYDDRGFDTSLGLAPNPTTAENAADARGAFDFLKSKGYENVGFIGHSEGGLIADMIAAGNDNVAFVVEIGGPAADGATILLSQNESILRANGLDDATVSMYLEAMKGCFDSQRNNSSKSFDESQYEIFSSEHKDNPIVAQLAQNLRTNILNLPPWLHYFINYDPIEDIKAIRCPLLMIYGERDTQVPPHINTPRLADSCQNALVKIFAGHNHMMQHCDTGNFNEYGEIEETISPEVLDTISTFISSLLHHYR